VRGFTQDDAHIFCLPDQIADEIKAGWLSRTNNQSALCSDKPTPCVCMSMLRLFEA
jgi:hypothetical protein